MPKLTKRFVDSIEPDTKDREYPDSEIKGLVLRVKPSGTMSYSIRYRTPEGRQRRLTLGKHGKITPHQARKLAKKHLLAVCEGDDPSAERQTQRAVGTVKELLERYHAEYSRRHKKTSTAKADAGAFRNHLIPALGPIKASALSRQEVAAFHRRLSERYPGAANRCLELLRGVYNWADRMELFSDPIRNPARNIRPNELPGPPNRELSLEQVGHLGKALEKAETGKRHSCSALRAVRLLLLTGCRRNEILELRWEDVDSAKQAIHLRDSKTGPRTVVVGSVVLEFLETAERNGRPWVCPGGAGGTYYKNIFHQWDRLRTAAGLEGLRLHDLRHTFASLAASLGVPYAVVASLLGHSLPGATARYARPDHASLVEAADQVSGAIWKAMTKADSI